MYQLKGDGIRILKIVHLLGVCAWVGGALCMTLLNRAQADSGAMLHGINYASHVIDMWVVVTLGVYVCLITGFLYGLMTPWGFFRHRWVAVKWLVTAICFLSGWMLLGRWENEMLELSRAMGAAALENVQYLGIRSSHYWLSLLQISLLAFMVSISIIKPWKNRTRNKSAGGGMAE